MENMLNKLVKTGEILEAGTYDAVTREEWWYPYYVEEKCPGLPDWKALKKCAHLFSENGLEKMGRYLGGPWEKPDRARVRALGLNFKIERVKKGDDLWVELEKAYRVKKPIILFNWTPNWIESKYKGKFVNFPEYHPKCETEPSWGISKKWKYDCGNPKAGWLKKVVWKGVLEKWPCALKVLRNFNFNNLMIAKLSSLVDSDKLSYPDAAVLWMKENVNVWKKWIPKNCRKI
jgi:glycine betaine/proline transport system substrate-binding protein